LCSGRGTAFSWLAKMEEGIRQRVYIETTIPSSYYKVRPEQEMIARGPHASPDYQRLVPLYSNCKSGSRT
jgi:hypothetical protein